MMKKQLLFAILPFVFAIPCDLKAQGHRHVYYFDNTFTIVPASEATYMGIGETAKGGFKFTAYQHPSGKIFVKGVFADSSLSIKNGLFTHYDSLGFAESEGNYVNDLREGYWVFWDNGIKDSVLYEDGADVLYISFQYHEENGAIASRSSSDKRANFSKTQYWDTAGVLKKVVFVGVEGDETITYYPNGKTKSIRRRNKSNDYTTRYFDESGKDITKKIEKQFGTDDMQGAYFPGKLDEPYFKAGRKELADFIKRNLDFKSEGTQTVGSSYFVLISFMLDESGRAKDIKVKGVSQETVLKIEGILRRMTRWEMNGHTSYGPISLNFQISNIY